MHESKTDSGGGLRPYMLRTHHPSQWTQYPFWAQGMHLCFIPCPQGVVCAPPVLQIVQMPSSRNGAVEQHEVLAVNEGNARGRENASGHKFSVSGCCWYPVDTGMFVTSSFDHTVKV